MQIAIVASEAQREEMSALHSDIVSWHRPGGPISVMGNIVIDLAQEPGPAKITDYKKASLILLNDPVGGSLYEELPVVRINGWNTFLKSDSWEATGNEELKEQTANALEAIGKKLLWCPDVPGLISARVVSMIINEAYLAFESGVSSRSDIDLAMKAGTNYPFGPFEWAEKIGKEKIVQLLQRMALSNKKYEPSSLLVEESENVTK